MGQLQIDLTPQSKSSPFKILCHAYYAYPHSISFYVNVSCVRKSCNDKENVHVEG